MPCVMTKVMTKPSSADKGEAVLSSSSESVFIQPWRREHGPLPLTSAFTVPRRSLAALSERGVACVPLVELLCSDWRLRSSKAPALRHLGPGEPRVVLLSEEPEFPSQEPERFMMLLLLLLLLLLF